MGLLSEKNTVHVEICLKQSEQRFEHLTQTLEPLMREYLKQQEPLKHNISLKIHGESATETDLKYVENFLLERDVIEAGADRYQVSPNKKGTYRLRFYLPQRHQAEMEMLEELGSTGDGEALPASKHWLMPSNEFVGLWENLIFEKGLKEKLLKFALSALSLSQHNVNTNIITCNRLLLLHGPPGTGKTSLCHALAQKLAIRARSVYRHAHLIEINSHSLFSKWFSESGKLVMRLFAKIHEMVADQNNLICVLIDEVESLAYARSAMSGQEPQDALRVVNALLTQLDGIKSYPNVLILATSNLADVIDLAFLDRADIRQYIGLPGVPAIKGIYESMFLELMRVGIMKRESLEAEDEMEGLITALAKQSFGMSGRTLRKLPFLAHALYTSSDYYEENEKMNLNDFLDSLLMALENYNEDQRAIEQKFECN